MSLSIEILIENCIRELRDGTLTEGNLLEVLTKYKNKPCRRQDHLYLQSQSTSVMSPVHGMSLVENGKVYDGSDNSEDWPYKTVLDAINEGWRIIKFPEMALLMDQDRTYGLGREFILERWSE